MGPVNVENETSQVTNIGERDSTTSNVWQLAHEGDKKGWRDEKAENQIKGSYQLLPHIMLALPRSHLHVSELVHCAACTPFAHGSRPNHRRKELLYRGGDILKQDALPTTAQRCDVAVSEFEEDLRVKDILYVCLRISRS